MIVVVVVVVVVVVAVVVVDVVNRRPCAKIFPLIQSIFTTLFSDQIIALFFVYLTLKFTPTFKFVCFLVRKTCFDIFIGCLSFSIFFTKTGYIEIKVERTLCIFNVGPFKNTLYRD